MLVQLIEMGPLARVPTLNSNPSIRIVLQAGSVTFFFSFQKSVHGYSLTIHTYYSLEFIDRAMSIERPSSEVLLRCSLSNGS